jgi:hypothetical protein
MPEEPIHGGILASVADVAVGYAMAFASSPPTGLVTASMTLDFAGTARIGDWMEAAVDVFSNKAGGWPLQTATSPSVSSASFVPARSSLLRTSSMQTRRPDLAFAGDRSRQADRASEPSMLVRMWWLVTIMFTALSMGVALAHLLEMPAKIAYDGALWLKLLQTLYPPAFGTIGAFFEGAAVVTAAVLTVLVRHHRSAFGWTLLGALCLVASHAAFWVWVAPVNAAMLPLTPETLPSDWTEAAESMGIHTRRARSSPDCCPRRHCVLGRC